MVLLRVVVCAVLLLALPVRAEPVEPAASSGHGPPAASSESQITQDSDRLLRAALAAYAADDLVKARELFEEVHRVRPSARTLRALGVLAYREARYGEAVSLLEQSLGSHVKPLTEELARGASELLGQARVLAEAAAEQPAPAASSSARVVASSHAAEPERAPDLRTAPAHPLPQLVGPDLRRIRRSSYALYAMAGAALVVAVATTALGATRVDEIEDSCRESAQGRCTPERADQLARRERLRLLSGLSIGSTVLAALSGASAVTLSIWLRGRADAAPLGGLTLQLRGRF